MRIHTIEMLNRIAAALFAPFLLGCRPVIVEQSHALSADGKSRLTLRYNTRDNRAFNYHDLVLEIRNDDEWQIDRTIWSGDSTLSPNRRRWVARLHSFDAAAETAIIQTGTELPVDEEGVVHVEYAWMQWDLRSNELLSVLHICDDPFEPPPDTVKDGG